MVKRPCTCPCFLHSLCTNQQGWMEWWGLTNLPSASCSPPVAQENKTFTVKTWNCLLVAAAFDQLNVAFCLLMLLKYCFWLNIYITQTKAAYSDWFNMQISAHLQSSEPCGYGLVKFDWPWHHQRGSLLMTFHFPISLFPLRNKLVLNYFSFMSD